jgi:hypothetical protein
VVIYHCNDCLLNNVMQHKDDIKKEITSLNISEDLAAPNMATHPVLKALIIAFFISSLELPRDCCFYWVQ